MNRNTRQHGFSLTETLMAVGTLAIGMMFIAGTFMTGVYFATVSTERAIGTVAAEEAFAKIQLYDPNLNVDSLRTTEFVRYDHLVTIPPGEYLYPSTRETNDVGQYSWSALCRRESAGSRLVQVVVFVSRKAGVHSRYWDGAERSWTDTTGVHARGSTFEVDLPHPLRTEIVRDPGSPMNEVRIVPTSSFSGLVVVMDGASIVDDATGQIYRVLERLADRPDTLRLDRPWTGGASGAIWAVSPAISGGRSPVVGVYQKVIRFPGGVAGASQTALPLRGR